MQLQALLVALTACIQLCPAAGARILQANGSNSDSNEAPVTWPIIGILSQAVPGKGGEPPSHSYFAASYPKYVAMSGAQAVPVLCGTPEDELKALYKQLNGLVVPGGAQDLRPGNAYYDTMALIMGWAMADFDASGETFPIHFTCLGWEAAAVKVTNNPYILSNFTGAEGVAAPLHWTSNAEGAWSHQYITPQLRAAAEDTGIVFEAHMYGIWVPDFWGTQLADFFDLLAITPDGAGKQYVSMVEAKRYPFVAMQWHPEKAGFEWGAPRIPHSADAVRLAQAVSLAFVEKARNSTHRFASAEALQEKLLYNHVPSHNENQTGGYFYEVYSFPFSPPDGHGGG